jgi:hypothetical protein
LVRDSYPALISFVPPPLTTRMTNLKVGHYKS